MLGQLRAAYVPQSLVVAAVEPPTSLLYPPPLRQRQQKRLEWTRQRWNRQERGEDQRGQARGEDLHSVQGLLDCGEAKTAAQLSRGAPLVP